MNRPANRPSETNPSGNRPPVSLGMTVRLVGGPTSSEGILRVIIDGDKVNVCEDGVDDRVAEVELIKKYV